MVRIRDRIEWNAIDRNVLLHQEMKIFLNFFVTDEDAAIDRFSGDHLRSQLHPFLRLLPG